MDQQYEAGEYGMVKKELKAEKRKKSFNKVISF